jgi:phosphatidylserine/phosphatidylglycerophosphate/cardiolipin synthase-like enzyme
MIVDGLWVSVGSTNFDRRSLSVDDEADLNIPMRPLPAGRLQCSSRTSRNPEQ